MSDAERARWTTPLALCAAGPLGGACLGVITNAINGWVSSDYFAIVMSWDGQAASLLAVRQGALEGAALGLFFGLFFAIAVAASTRLRCPLNLAMRTLFGAMAIALICWLLGGVIGLILAKLWPQLWGFFFVGVPTRVNLPRFAWVGGSIWGVYGGTLLALVACSIYLHLSWRRVGGPVSAFPVLTRSAEPRVQ